MTFGRFRRKVRPGQITFHAQEATLASRIDQAVPLCLQRKFAPLRLDARERSYGVLSEEPMESRGHRHCRHGRDPDILRVLFDHFPSGVADEERDQPHRHGRCFRPRPVHSGNTVG